MKPINSDRFNRIVIIGNGFDLALKLKTGYKDFLIDYLQNAIKSTFDGSFKGDNLLNRNEPLYFVDPGMIKLVDNISEIKEIEKFMKLNVKGFRFSELLQTLISKIKTNNWVDIESLYFNLLQNKVEQIKTVPVLNRSYLIVEKLNDEFSSLQEALKKYISKINEKLHFQPLSHPVATMIDGLFDPEYPFSQVKHNTKGLILAKVLFLNFNYTASLDKILNSKRRLNYLHIPIHGQVNDVDNPIIFGYGDDAHHYYSHIEIEDNTELLKYFKTFHYSLTENYQMLLDFVEHTNYEVFVVGHSCGLSDRTLLKAIFEDEKCIRVVICHRGYKEDYFPKNMAVSRHFSDKLKFREKVLPFNPNAKIPQ